MPVINRGAASATTVTTTNATVNVSPTVSTSTQSYMLIAVAVSVNLAVTSITATTGSGTFTLLGSTNNGTQRLELWLGYNFSPITPTTSISVVRAAGTAVMDVICRVVDIYGDASSVPAFVLSTPASGTSTLANAGPVTPAVGDILFAAVHMASASADSSVRTSIGNTYVLNTGVEQSSTRHEMAYADAINAVSSDLQWTLTASVAWIGMQASLTPAVSTPSSSALLKGFPTAATDAASSF